MQKFKSIHSTADTWDRAAKECVEGLDIPPDGANLGFIYVTDIFAADLSSILTYVRHKTSIEHWVGSVGVGVCSGEEEYFDHPAVAVMVAALPESAFGVFPTITEHTGELPAAYRAWMDSAKPTFGIVHGDPENANTPRLIENLGHDTSGFLVGGLTSSRSASHQVAEGVTEGGVSGVLFAPEVSVATGLSQGCAPIGQSHVVSDCVDNVIIGLDGRPALDVFKEDIGDILARDLTRVAGYIHAAFPIEGSDTGDYVVRNLTGIDPARGWLAVGDSVEPGSRVLFVCRDPESAEGDLVGMLDSLKRRVVTPPKGGVYISCVARGANMFGEVGREMELIRKHLGTFPLIGFYAGGEISNNRLYSYTGVLTLFL